MKQEDVLKIVDQLADRFDDKIEGLALLTRQSGTPSHVLMEIKNDLKKLAESLSEVKTQTVKTNGRVTALERWKLILTTAVAVLVATKFPALASVASLF